jgi:hypothetical protein
MESSSFNKASLSGAKENKMDEITKVPKDDMKLFYIGVVAFFLFVVSMSYIAIFTVCDNERAGATKKLESSLQYGDFIKAYSIVSQYEFTNNELALMYDRILGDIIDSRGCRKIKEIAGFCKVEYSSAKEKRVAREVIAKSTEENRYGNVFYIYDTCDVGQPDRGLVEMAFQYYLSDDSGTDARDVAKKYDLPESDLRRANEVIAVKLLSGECARCSYIDNDYYSKCINNWEYCRNGYMKKAKEGMAQVLKEGLDMKKIMDAVTLVNSGLNADLALQFTEAKQGLAQAQ